MLTGLPNLAPGLGARDAYFGGGLGYNAQSSVGTATWASPAGPQTATRAGFGTIAGGNGSMSSVGTGVLSTGAICLGLLVFIYITLPR
jgi:hypothetical protein